MLSSTWAWISTPGMAGSFGVVFRSSRPAAEVPIRTSRARHAIRGDAAFQHIDGGDVARLVVRREMHPKLAVAVGRHLKAGQRDALDAGRIHPDQDGAGAGRHPQHLEGQRRHDLALRLHDHRHAPHDAVALGADAEQPAPGGGVFEDRNVSQQPREVEHERTSDRRRASRRRPAAAAHRACGCDRRQAGLAEHDPRLLDRVGHDLIVARQRAQLVPGFLVEIAKDVRRERRRQPVGLGEDDVEGDGGGAELGQARDQVGDARARPRPLAELAQAFLVDIDDDDRPLRRRRAA